MDDTHTIWIEKYRPSTLADIVGQDEIVERLSSYVRSGNLPHLLFTGSAGVGKTTAAVTLAREFFKDSWQMNFRELNASDERGIDVVRNQIKQFARTSPLGDATFKILFLDEPTVGIDVQSRIVILEYLHELRKKGTTIIYTSHYMEEAENLCDYIIIMDNGKILKEGTLQELLEEDSVEKIVEFTAGHIPVNKIIYSGDSSFSVYPGETKEKGFVRLNNFETQLPAFMSFMKENNITIKHMECRRKTLDDLFVSLTGRTINE